MPKNLRLDARIDAELRQKIQELSVVLGLNQSAVIHLAINRLHQQEIKTMTAQTQTVNPTVAEKLALHYAMARVYRDEELYLHRDILIDYPWDNYSEHLQWVVAADKAELLAWIRTTREASSPDTYYIDEQMLGDEATEQDARWMVELLSRRGYTVAYGHAIGQNEDAIRTEDWEACLDDLSELKYTN